MNTTQTTTGTRQAAVTGLAVVGFVALVVAGIWLAVYSTRFVPTVVNRIGAAAVFLGSVFTPSPAPGLSVISTTSSTTIPFGEASSTISRSVTDTKTASPAPKTVGAETSTIQQIEGTGTVTPSGFPDLSASIDSIGYLTTASADSFVVASTVPHGSRPAVKFTIKNIGTNWTGTWRFTTSIPTHNSFVYQSDVQQSLGPGDSIDYTLGFDQANTGADQIISITANSDNAAADSNPNNNSASTKITVLGS